MKPATREAQSPDLVQGLGLVSSITIVMGSMIGSGIFIVSADIARQVQSPGLLIVTWGLTAFMTIVGALSYGELAAAMPRAGGRAVRLPARGARSIVRLPLRLDDVPGDPNRHDSCGRGGLR